MIFKELKKVINGNTEVILVLHHDEDSKTVLHRGKLQELGNKYSGTKYRQVLTHEVIDVSSYNDEMVVDLIK